MANIKSTVSYTSGGDDDALYTSTGMITIANCDILIPINVTIPANNDRSVLCIKYHIPTPLIPNTAIHPKIPTIIANHNKSIFKYFSVFFDLETTKKFNLRNLKYH